jgi:hypothetical protein
MPHPLPRWESPNARQIENVRALIAWRLAGVPTPHEEAAEYVRLLLARGITTREIAERCGVQRTAVNGWNRGRCAPGSRVCFERLAMMTRNALPLPVIERTPPTGMALVIDTIRRVGNFRSGRELQRSLGHLGKTRGWALSHTAFSHTSPGRLVTLQLRQLALRLGLPLALIEICDLRLIELAENRRNMMKGWTSRVPGDHPGLVAMRAVGLRNVTALNAKRREVFEARCRLAGDLKRAGFPTGAIAVRLGVDVRNVNVYIRGTRYSSPSLKQRIVLRPRPLARPSVRRALAPDGSRDRSM